MLFLIYFQPLGLTFSPRNTVIILAGCLNIFVDVSVSGTLGPVIIVVKATVDLILSIVINLNVFLGVH